MGNGTSLYRAVILPGASVPGNLFLAPLAGYTDAAFRQVCLEAGASMAFTEMVSAEALSRGGTRTVDMARRASGERLLAVQLFASRPDAAARAVERLLPLSPDLLDLNCGCSVPKVLRGSCGAALLRDPDLIGRIVRAMAEASRTPVSVKLRSGWDAESVTYLAAAAAAVSAGACMVSLHPRTRAQGFTGSADWSHIAALKQSVQVPVVGSGDLWSGDDVRAMVERTGCDAVMLARGAIGNPFIFAEARAALEGRPLPPPPPPRERLGAALRHLELAVALRGEALACREMRKQLLAYTRGMPGGARLRQALVTASTRADYLGVVEAYLAMSGGEERSVATRWRA
jgi:tRNA-dihydrouridine synthase B